MQNNATLLHESIKNCSGRILKYSKSAADLAGEMCQLSSLACAMPRFNSMCCRQIASKSSFVHF